jgi:dTDP-D-glucose 4,6-dehydratase
VPRLRTDARAYVAGHNGLVGSAMRRLAREGFSQSIAELAQTGAEIVYPNARLVCDTSKADGTRRKLLDVSRLHGLGWTHQIALRQGIESTYQWFLNHMHEARGAAPSAPAV